LGCFCGAFSPSRLQIRSTRFLFTLQAGIPQCGRTEGPER
jgi:hypothetical protein